MIVIEGVHEDGRPGHRHIPPTYVTEFDDVVVDLERKIAGKLAGMQRPELNGSRESPLRRVNGEYARPIEPTAAAHVGRVQAWTKNSVRTARFHEAPIEGAHDVPRVLVVGQ
ncbi:MAG: hypothetical protein QOI01_1333 [Mycobacterium sp.]|nr:hypothetical protein [Mycobacterium sp.]